MINEPGRNPCSSASIHQSNGVLEPAEQILGVLQAQADCLEPVTGLVQLQDHLIPDHGVIIADDAKLKLNVQGRRHAGLSTNLVW
jgi:hypothetical protein